MLLDALLAHPVDVQGVVLHSVVLLVVVRLVTVSVLTGVPPASLLASPGGVLDVQELAFDALLADVLLDALLLHLVDVRDAVLFHVGLFDDEMLASCCPRARLLTPCSSISWMLGTRCCTTSCCSTLWNWHLVRPTQSC